MIYGGTGKALHILMLEDAAENVALYERELNRAGLVFSTRRVDNRASFVESLTDFHPDLILLEYALPGLDALTALKIVRRDHPEIPVIILSDRLGDTEAVELIHAGAKDYVLKNQLSKLPLAVLHVLTVEHGIRERKAAEKAIRESRELFMSISASAQDAIILLDQDGRIAFWNAAAERIMGYTAAEATGKDAHTLLAPARFHVDCTRGLAHFRSTGSGPVIGKTLELVAMRKDGTEFPIELSVSTLQLQGKWHAVGILRDISERKQYQQNLQKTMADLAEAQQLAHIGNWSWDVPMDAIAWSPEYYRIYNLDPAQPTPNYAEHLQAYTAESARRLEAAVKRALESGEPYALELELAAGKWVLARGAARLDATGKVAALFGTAQDITERKLAEKTQDKLARALALLSSGNRTLVHAHDEQSLLAEICRLTVEAGGYLMAWVGFAEQDAGKTVSIAAASGHEEGYLNDIQISWGDNELGQGPTGTAIRTRAVQINQNCLTNPQMAPWRDAALKRGYQASIALPLLYEEHLFGVLTIYAREPDAFIPEETGLLEELAADLAFGIHSLRTRNERNQAILERQHYAERLRISLEDALQAIATTIEMRDPYTAGHQRRVAHLATAIAREMDLPEVQVHGLHLASTVHDLGKINVPAEILSKPGRLSEIELSLIKTHAQAGYDILKGIEFPWPIAQTVLQHHERLDGSGYPQGLRDGQIILEARILAVADIVEAMSSHRPYRPGLGNEVALDEITRNRGTLYDAAVVDACVRLFTERGYRVPSPLLQQEYSGEAE